MEGNKITNPFLENDLTFEIENSDSTVKLNILNINKFFKKLFIICPLKNEETNTDILKYYIDKNDWSNIQSKMVLVESSFKIIKNKIHYQNLLTISKEKAELFNHFGYEIEENDNNKVLVVLIFDIAYKDLNNYLKIYDGLATFKDIWNIILLKNYWYKNDRLNYASKIIITEMIKNMEETYYWTRRYNCLSNITTKFNQRRFTLAYTKNIINDRLKKILKDLEKDDTENNYLTMIFNNKRFVDASSAIKKYGYKLYQIRKKEDLSIEDINSLFENLNGTQKFYLFCNLIVSKRYCHLVVKNYDLMKSMKLTINYFKELFRYLFSYVWIRFYFEECIKKTWIKKDDEFILDINCASLLPTFPFTISDVKRNPYLPIMVDDKSLQSENNIGGIRFYCYDTKQNKSKCGKITDLDGFRVRMNIFISGNSQLNIFNGLDLYELGVGMSGSLIPACVQESHPLMELCKGKNMYNAESTFDLDFNRYFSEYYCNADLDLMIRSINCIDFIKKVKKINNQIIVNLCQFNPSYFEIEHIKVKTIRTINIFINDDFIRNNLVTDSMTYEYILGNLSDEKILLLILPHFNKIINEFYDDLLKDFSEEEVTNFKKEYSELFDNNETNYEVYYSDSKKVTNKITNFSNVNNIDIEAILQNSDDEINKFDFESDFVDQGRENNFRRLLREKKIGVAINFKVKINAKPHLTRELELFPVIGDDFFALVSKFHLPCVRGYYDGNNVYLTPSCISANKTYMNLDYKYFAGSKDPIEIVNKYRMRGFGTFLNKNEIDKLIKYSSSVDFWKNLYAVNLESKNSIKNALGELNFSHKIFRPRFYNADILLDGDVDLSDPYNNIDDKMEEKMCPVNDTYENFRLFINRTSVKKINNVSIPMEKIYELSGINSYGYIEPLQKWTIDYAFNIGKKGYLESSSNEEEIEEPLTSSSNPFVMKNTNLAESISIFPEINNEIIEVFDNTFEEEIDNV